MPDRFSRSNQSDRSYRESRIDWTGWNATDNPVVSFEGSNSIPIINFGSSEFGGDPADFSVILIHGEIISANTGQYFISGRVVFHLCPDLYLESSVEPPPAAFCIQLQ